MLEVDRENVAECIWGLTHFYEKAVGRDPVRVNDGLGGRGIGKKRMAACNEVHRGSIFALTRNGADPIVVVSHCMKGGKPVNVRLVHMTPGFM
uniref:Uncharacterized protein n=1 Tax=Candidatus Methanogaster sp. ANME-2c ERB4 TaxID=2759911 RepID=A0A7G9Y4M8_9EURY|nr:hypothetical protein MNOMIAMN_00002 [Methanosarcinales archaeon ANME-2c ERB4]